MLFRSRETVLQHASNFISQDGGRIHLRDCCITFYDRIFLSIFIEPFYIANPPYSCFYTGGICVYIVLFCSLNVYWQIICCIDQFWCSSLYRTFQTLYHISIGYLLSFVWYSYFFGFLYSFLVFANILSIFTAYRKSTEIYASRKVIYCKIFMECFCMRFGLGFVQ